MILALVGIDLGSLESSVSMTISDVWYPNRSIVGMYQYGSQNIYDSQSYDAPLQTMGEEKRKGVGKMMSSNIRDIPHRNCLTLRASLIHPASSPDWPK